MARKRKVRVLIHDDAEPEWSRFLAALPGQEQDKLLLMRTYIVDWVKRILPRLRSGDGPGFECPFVPDHVFYFMLEEDKTRSTLFVMDVQRCS